VTYAANEHWPIPTLLAVQRGPFSSGSRLLFTPRGGGQRPRSLVTRLRRDDLHIDGIPIGDRHVSRQSGWMYFSPRFQQESDDRK